MDAELLLPLRYPRKVLCSGANYRSHMREMKVNRPDDALPYFFLKPPTTSLVGPGAPIVVPPSVGTLFVGSAHCEMISHGKKKNETAEVITLSLTFDHRIVNGAGAANFVHEIKEQIERFKIPN